MEKERDSNTDSSRLRLPMAVLQRRIVKFMNCMIHTIDYAVYRPRRLFKLIIIRARSLPTYILIS